jgi:hypothetical protein
MKSFKSYLIEAVNYEEMFKILESDPSKLKRAKFEIIWAKKNLLKQDRITWFLRIVKLKFLTPEQRAIEFKELSKKGANWDDEYTAKIISSEGEFEKFRNEFSKLITSDIPEASNIEFKFQSPSEIMKELKGRGQEYADKTKEVIFDEDDSDYETVVEFPNGWRWINLNKPWCGKEGAAMHHCGNYPEMKPTDKVLSLREPRRVGGKLGWKPHLTFILEKGNVLGQATGRAMTKPKKDLHPYIVALLINKKLPIEGIGSETLGAQDAKANFRLSDLSEADLKKVLEANPDLRDSL